MYTNTQATAHVTLHFCIRQLYKWQSSQCSSDNLQPSPRQHTLIPPSELLPLKIGTFMNLKRWAIYRYIPRFLTLCHVKWPRNNIWRKFRF